MRVLVSDLCLEEHAGFDCSRQRNRHAELWSGVQPSGNGGPLLQLELEGCRSPLAALD